MMLLDALLNDLRRQWLATAADGDARVAFENRLDEISESLQSEYIAYACGVETKAEQDPRIVAYHDVRECLKCVRRIDQTPQWLDMVLPKACRNAYHREILRLAVAVRAALGLVAGLRRYRKRTAFRQSRNGLRGMRGRRCFGRGAAARSTRSPSLLAREEGHELSKRHPPESRGRPTQAASDGIEKGQIRLHSAVVGWRSLYRRR
ncbi:hypothetical protein LVJ94_34675 [Pendulispora rubella]|uniref:Uncharacterized protein n=1 Tax=Pendulispora rubella TaxID=2741070 RepID=A0ABZ2KU14_9BACT